MKRLNSSNCANTPPVGLRRTSLLLALLLSITFGVGQMWGATYTYDFTKGSNTSYWTSDNKNTSVGTSNIESFYYMQSGYSGHHFTAGNGSTSTHNHRFNTTNNQQCFFLGKTGEYLTLPTYANEIITSVKIWGNTQGSNSASVNIYAGSTAASSASAIYNTNHSFSINTSYQSSTLSVKLASSHNAGITKIEITTSSSCNKSVTVTTPSATHGTISGATTVATCSATAADRQVTLTVTPSSGYGVPTDLTLGGTITPTKVSGPTSNGAGAYTYVYQFAQNANGSTSFSATCPELQKYKVTFSTGTGNSTVNAITEASVGSGVTLPAGPSTIKCASDGWSFAGWSETNVSSETTTAPTLLPTGNYKPASDITLYAVYKKSVTTGDPIAQSKACSYSSHSGWTTSDGICTPQTPTYWILCTGSSITSPVINDLSTITSIVIKTRTYGGDSYKTTSIKTSGNVSVGTINASSTSLANKTLSLSTNNLSGSGSLIFSSTTNTDSKGPGIQEITINYTAAPTTDYYWSAPDCCDPLGSINGSISWTNGTQATLSWANNSNVNSYSVTCKQGETSKGTVGSVTGTTTKSCTVTELTAGQTYTFTINASGDATHCDASQEISATAPKITATADLGDFGYAQGSNPEEQSFTVNGTALTGDLTVKAPANYLIKVGTGEWSSAGGNKSIIVSTPPNNLSSTTIYVKAATGLNEGDNPSGNIEITGGGAAKVEVAVSATITSACAVNPTIGAATLKAGGAFGLDGVAVSVTGMNPGTNCTWTDYGFYWGTVDNKKAHKVEIGNSGNATSFETTLAFTAPAQFAAGTTYYFCAYGKNAKSGAEIICGTEASFTPYTVSYNKNDDDATGSVTTQVVNTGGSVTLPNASAFTLGCNDLTKWALNSADGETKLNPGATYSNITANAEFFAIWNKRTYTISYAAGNTPLVGAEISGSRDNETKTCGKSFTMPGVVFTVTGYTQTGWRKTIDGNTSTNGLGGSYGVDADQTFYPFWTINTYDISKGTATGCSGNDFTLSASSVDHYGSITVTASPDNAHKGSAQVSVSPSGNATVSGTTISNIIGDIEVSVSFSAKETASIILHDAGGQSTVSGTHYEMDNYTLPNTAAACTESEFYGWYTEAYSSESTAPSGDKYIAKNASKALVAGENHFYAVYATVEDRYTNNYTKITSVNDLTTGDYLISSGSYCMGNTITSNRMAETSLSANNNVKSNPAASLIWTITKSGTKVTLYNDNASKYLAVSGGVIAVQTNAHNFTFDYGTTKENSWTFTSETSPTYQLSYSTISGNSYDYFVMNTSQTAQIDLYKRDKAPSAGAPYTTSPSCTSHTLSSAIDPSSPVGGSVELGKTTVLETKTTTATATPSDHYTFSHWTISGAGASLENADGEGKSTDNPVTVTMGTADATITAHFTEKPKCTVEFYNNGGAALSSTTYWLGETPEAPTLNDGTTGEGNACDETSDKHYGWTQTAWQQTITKDDVDAKTAANVKVYTKGSALPAIEAGDNGKTIKYYAVWAHATNSSVSKDFTLSLTSSNFPSAYGGSWPNSGVVTANEVNGTATMDVTLAGDQIGTYTNIQFKANAGYFYNKTDLGSITGITLNNNDLTAVKGTTENPSSGTNGGYFKISNGTGNAKNTTGITINFTKTVDGVAYSAFLTNCCTPLPTIVGAISVGSINEGGGTASWSWSGEVTTGISKNILKVYNTSDVLVKTIDNISGSATSQSITGLDPCTSYYATLTTVAEDGYCAGVEQGQSANFTTNGWAVHYTGGDATEGALLSNVTKLTGDNQACLSEDYVATFSANDGFELPETIVVYIAGVEVTAGVDYTWVISNGIGTLTIETDGLSGEIDVRIIGEALDCQNDPAVGTASLSGTINLGEVGVTVSSCNTGSAYCGWIDYGFVWGMSDNPTVSDHKVQVSTSGKVTTWNGSLEGSFVTGETYYFRAYGKNSKDGAAFVYSASDATFTPQSVTFNKNNGEDNDVVYVNSGSAVAQPSNPSRMGYEFVKWQKEGSDYVFSSAVDDNITLDAVWTPNQYTLAWNSNGGSTLDGSYTSGSTDCGATLTPPTNPTREGYNFTGWNSAENGTGDAYTGTMPAGNVTYYAQWSIITCSVTWSVNGNNTYADDDPAEPTTSVTYNSKVTTLPTAPTSAECDDAKKFMGWRAEKITDTSASAPDGIFTDIEHSPQITDDVTFYAVFATETVGDIVLIKDIDDLADGDKVYIYSEFEASETTYGAVAKAYESGNNVRAASGTVANEKLTPGTGACAYTFGKVKVSNTDYYTFNDGTYYLYSSNTSKNYLQGETDLDNNDYGLFTVEINGTTGVATIRSKGNTSRSYMQFNKNNDTGDYENALFACYQTASQTSVKLFKKNPDVYSDYVTKCASCDADATFTTALPAISAEDCTSATVTATDGLATLGSEGCNISDYGFVLGTATNPELDGEGVTKLQVGTSNPTVGEDFSYDMTGLTKGTHYYVRAYAVNKHGVAYSSMQDFWTKDVSSIAITTAPTKTNYIAGETFDATGMVVTATLAGGATEDVTADVTFSDAALTAGTSQNFAINYTLCETGKSVNQVINVYTLAVNEGTNTDGGTLSYTAGSGATFAISGLAERTTCSFDIENGTIQDNSNGTYTVINPTGNVTVTVNYVAASQVTVSYSVNGTVISDLTPNDKYQGETVTLPTANELATAMSALSMTLNEYGNFAGWSETEFAYQTTEPTLVSGTPTVNADKTFYAVFTNLESRTIGITDITSSQYPTTEQTLTKGGIDFKYHYVLKGTYSTHSYLQFKSHASQYGRIYNNTSMTNLIKIETGYNASQASKCQVPVYACSAAGTISGSALTAESRGDADPYVYVFPENTQYFIVKGDNSNTYYPDYITIYYASEAVYYATQFKTVTYDITGTDKEVKVALNKEYTIDNEEYGDAPEGGINAYWKDAGNKLYSVGDKIVLTSNMTLTPVWSQVVRGSLTEGKMGTICPKQEVKAYEGASFYELSYKTIENGMPYKVFFDEIAEGASLEAGKPYLFVADGEAITGVKVGDEAEHTAGISNNSYNGFYGILTDNYKLHVENQDDVDSYKYYIITNNEIRLCGLGDFNIPAERAYINMSALTEGEVAQAPGRRRVCLTNQEAQVATGMENAQSDQVQSTKVLIDGQLFIIRCEKMYNANGQVVK